MSECEHCGGRGWGIRYGFVRRCEVCCRFKDDPAARVAAEPELARFALRERPSARVLLDTAAMRCPWCDHLPSNEGFDTFWMLSAGDCYARARVGRVGAARADPSEEELKLLLGDTKPDEDGCDELRLQCPNPACLKTFSLPDLDFDRDPVQWEWTGRDWVRRVSRP